MPCGDHADLLLHRPRTRHGCCGFSLDDDPKLEEALAWSRDFKAENPELARQLSEQCETEIGRSAWTRDGSLALFNCIRAKAKARGQAWEATAAR